MSQARYGLQAYESSNSLGDVLRSPSARRSAEPESYVYPAGLELFRQGSIPLAVYLVEEGLIKLTRCDDEGREILVDLKFAGAVVGAAASIAGRNHLVNASTVTSCKLARWNSVLFEKALHAPSFLASVSRMLSVEVLGQISRISDLTLLPARHRLEQFLWRLSDTIRVNRTLPDSEASIKLQLPIKQWEAAEYLSITPTYLSQLIRVLEKEELISRDRGWIMIPKPESLWHSLDY